MENLHFNLLPSGPFQRILPKEYEGFHGDLWRTPGTKVHEINCEGQSFDFSSHASHAGLAAFAKDTGAARIVLFHGNNRAALVGDLSEFAKVHLPVRGEHFRAGK